MIPKALSLFLLFEYTVYATSVDAYALGKNLYFEHGCSNCHGTNAEGSSYYPRLAHQKQDYLIQKLNAFKKGIAMTQKQEIMFTFVKPLDQKDFKNLSIYLSKLKKDTSKKYDIEEDLLGVDF